MRAAVVVVHAVVAAHAVGVVRVGHAGGTALGAGRRAVGAAAAAANTRPSFTGTGQTSLLLQRWRRLRVQCQRATELWVFQ